MFGQPLQTWYEKLGTFHPFLAFTWITSPSHIFVLKDSSSHSNRSLPPSPQVTQWTFSFNALRSLNWLKSGICKTDVWTSSPFSVSSLERWTSPSTIGGKSSFLGPKMHPWRAAGHWGLTGREFRTGTTCLTFPIGVNPRKIAFDFMCTNHNTYIWIINASLALRKQYFLPSISLNILNNYSN